MSIIAAKGKQPIQPMKRYYEVQSLRNWLLWIILIGLLLFFTFASLSQIVFGLAIGSNPMPNWALIVGVIFTAVLTVALARTQLILDLDSEQFHLTFGPLGALSLKWNEIKSLKIIKLPRLGYGKRQHQKYGTVYNAGAKEGLLLELKNGAKILISTRRKKELQEFLRLIKKLKA